MMVFPVEKSVGTGKYQEGLKSKQAAWVMISLYMFYELNTETWIWGLLQKWEGMQPCIRCNTRVKGSNLDRRKAKKG